jgi:hypothetical protein
MINGGAMPKSQNKGGKAATANRSDDKTERRTATYESTSWLNGLFQEFAEQTKRYNALTGQLLAMEARIGVTEKNLCLTRDHFAMTIAETQDAVPNDWSKVLNSVRFVGVRLADACAKSLQDHGKKMAPEELLHDLNDGMFRFRTNSPLREIHAALLRHPHVKRNGGFYVWTAPPAEKQLPMRLRVVQREVIPLEPSRGKMEVESGNPSVSS